MPHLSQSLSLQGAQNHFFQTSPRLIFAHSQNKDMAAPATPVPSVDWADAEWRDSAPVGNAMSPERLPEQDQFVDEVAAQEEARRRKWKTDA